MITIVHQSGRITRTNKELVIQEVAEILPETIFFFEDPVEVLREALGNAPDEEDKTKE